MEAKLFRYNLNLNQVDLEAMWVEL
jgi:hypothetical protein